LIPLKDNVPTRSFPVVTVALIAANVLVYVLYQRAGFEAPAGPIDEGGYHPCEVNDSCRVVGLDWPPTTLISMFMHADLLHLAGNMLFLWIFGNNVEDALGRVRFLVFYLLAGYAAIALQTVVTLETAPRSADIPNLGASGAISGVLGAYAVLLPRASVLTVIILVVIFFLREIPAIFFLGIYFVFQVWQAGLQFTHPPEGGGVAVFAHVGGFVFGAATVLLFRKRSPLRPAY
jgi:membrane associated rhomboid family serine protease